MGRTGRRSHAAFTLLEIVIVMAIVTALVTLAMPVLGATLLQERTRATREEMDALETSILDMFEDTWSLPSSLSQLETNQPPLSGWSGPYRVRGDRGGGDFTDDAWKRPYVIDAAGFSAVRLRSPGPDGVLDTADDLAKLVDVTPLRRRLTKKEIAEVAEAVDAYYASNTDPLPVDVSQTLTTLSGLGYLPARTDVWLLDGWLCDYVPVAGALNQLVRFDSLWGPCGGGKITVCHVTGQGSNTLQVPPAALPAHLAHGDSLGPCP